MSKNVLVTGGAGFIGSHVVDAYIEAGHKVFVVDDLSAGVIDNVNDRASAVFINNINDISFIRNILQTERIDIVNHHAAHVSVRESIENPIEDADQNILGTLAVIQACKGTNVKKFVFASSGGTVYGENWQRTALDETTKLAPTSPYGVSKVAAEMYLETLCNSMGIDLHILRYGNVYGPRQDPSGEAGVVSIFLDRAMKNLPLEIFGDGSQARDFIYVEDIAKLNVLVSDSLIGTVSPILGFGPAWNVGSGTATTITEIAERIINIVEPINSDIVYQAAKPGELMFSCLHSWAAKRDFNWTATTSLETGIFKTYESILLRDM